MIDFVPDGTGTGHDVRRASVRHGWQHVLRCVAIATDLGGGDMVHGVILFTIVNANSTLLRLSNGDKDYDSLHGSVADDTLRKPVSVYAVARRLGLPYETVRRHVGKLVEEGRCIRVGPRGGVIVPASAIEQMRPNVVIQDSLDALDELIISLDRVGALRPRAQYNIDRSVMIG
jgi:hypothetical protein